MHKFNPDQIERLVSTERTEEMAPEALLRAEGLGTGDVVADIGCGPGFFTLPAALLVGESGRVYAVDTEQKMLDHLAERKPPANVIALKSEEQSIPIEDVSIDFALLVFVLHEACDTAAFLGEILRLVRPGGKFVVIDWKKQSEKRGPPEEDRIAEQDAAALVGAAGFVDVASASLNGSHYKVTALKGEAGS